MVRRSHARAQPRSARLLVLAGPDAAGTAAQRGVQTLHTPSPHQSRGTDAGGSFKAGPFKADSFKADPLLSNTEIRKASYESRLLVVIVLVTQVLAEEVGVIVAQVPLAQAREVPPEP